MARQSGQKQPHAPSSASKQTRPDPKIASGPALLRIRLTPKGGRDAVTRYEEGILYARVSAPPVDGAANKALIALVAETLAVPKSSVAFHAGETSRDKVLRLETLSESELQQRLQAHIVPTSQTEA